MYLTFGEWLQEKRKATGMTQTELGERVGMSKMQVGRLESGLQKATADRVRPLIEALNIDEAEAAPWLERMPALSPKAVTSASKASLESKASLNAHRKMVQTR
ncbi:MAG: helix-turn-helix transcriptional regulator [Armatimonadota bacterium]